MDCTTYEKDERNPPEEQRKIKFREGWNFAIAGGIYKSEKTLKSLKWENLGYRLGKLFGETPPDLIDGIFDWCAKHYNSQGRIK